MVLLRPTPTDDTAAPKALSLPVGAASPLWLAFLSAASAGVAFWWMTRWARPAVVDAPVQKLAAPIPPVPETPAPAPVFKAVEPKIEPKPEAPIAPKPAAKAPVAEAAAPKPVAAPKPKPIKAPVAAKAAAPAPTVKAATAPKAKSAITVVKAAPAPGKRKKPPVKASGKAPKKA